MTSRASSDDISSERGRQERGQDAPEEEIFHRVTDALVPGLHPFAYQPHARSILFMKNGNNAGLIKSTWPKCGEVSHMVGVGMRLRGGGRTIKLQRTASLAGRAQISTDRAL
jgi:hypothetical protein